MTTALRKTDSHKKARAISSGFLKLINTFMLTPRQGLADKRTSFRSVVKNHEGNDTTPVSDIASVRVAKSIIQKAYSPPINGGLSNERRQTTK